MPQDKRPKQTIDMLPNSTAQPVPPLELPGPDGPQSDKASQQEPASDQPDGTKRRDAGGFYGYLLAGILGGLVVTGGIYFASTQGIPGLSLTDPDTRRQIYEVRDRIGSLDSSLHAAPQPVSPSANSVTGRLEGLNEVQARLDGIVNASRALQATVQSLSQRLQAVERKNGDAQIKEAIQTEVTGQLAALSQRLASIERDLEALTRAQNERQADARAAALTLALTNLKRAVADGRAFSGELTAVENLSTVKLPVSELTPYKDTGVLSLAELQREFAEISRKAIQSYYRSSSNSVMSEVISRAKAAIQVKPTGSTGDSVEAILGRMETSLKAGDLQAALTEGAALQGPARQEMQAWLAKAQARAVADETLRKTDEELLASLTRAPGRYP
jgi:hypothetical protein